MDQKQNSPSPLEDADQLCPFRSPALLLETPVVPVVLSPRPIKEREATVRVSEAHLVRRCTRRTIHTLYFRAHRSTNTHLFRVSLFINKLTKLMTCLEKRHRSLENFS